MKKVVYCRYVHKSNYEELARVMNLRLFSALSWCMEYAKSNNLPFEIIKYDTKQYKVSLINAIDWDTLYEPIVGDSHNFDISLEPKYLKTIKGGKTVYHRKHEFVGSDYTGFDIQDSIKRTETLEAIPEINNNKNSIGSLRIWRQLLDKYNLPVYMDK